jgi:hypothetical protein
MTPIYSRIREHAREIAARFPEPAFYQDHSQSHSFSEDFFNSDPVITKLRHYLASHLEDNYGHGMEHATKVTLEAGVLMKIEGTAAGYAKKLLEARMRVVQCAGLLQIMLGWVPRMPAMFCRTTPFLLMKSKIYIERFTTMKPLPTI